MHAAVAAKQTVHSAAPKPTRYTALEHQPHRAAARVAPPPRLAPAPSLRTRAASSALSSGPGSSSGPRVRKPLGTKLKAGGRGRGSGVAGDECRCKSSSLGVEYVEVSQRLARDAEVDVDVDAMDCRGCMRREFLFDGGR